MTREIHYIWLFQLGRCELVHIFVCWKGKPRSNYVENIRSQLTKFNLSGQPDARNLCIISRGCFPKLLDHPKERKASRSTT